VAIMTYLIKDSRTGIYYHRRAVPAELRKVVGKREIKRSLKTKNPKEAKRLNQEVGPEVDRILQSAQDSVDGLPLLDDAQAEALAARWLHKALQEDVEDRALATGGDKDADHLSDFLGDVREALAAPVNLKFARSHVQEVLEDGGLVVPEGTEAYRKLSLAMLRALAVYAKTAMERSLGRWNETQATAPPDLPVVLVSPQATPSLRLLTSPAWFAVNSGMPARGRSGANPCSNSTWASVSPTARSVTANPSTAATRAIR